MKASIKWGITLILGSLLLSACSEQSVTKEEASPEVQSKVEESSGSNKTETAAAEPKKEDVEEPAEEEVLKAKAGETLNINGVKITVVDIAKFDGRMNQFEPLKEDHPVKINVIIENTNKDSVFVDSMEFKLYDTDGFELSSALPGDEEKLSADLPGGKKAKGAIFFDVPVQEGTWELHYEALASFGGDPAIWELEAK
ncbi:DUF4352 domain-containing protein [Paenibacillus lautus]|uniref:DUF4352 domain-containing protein n=1 Tax=Paenibacillus lautus TaxID=1401 RepID=UPI0013C4F400|nr:DUF4352 domain-containing protein [Paenibacillus lautus]